MDYGRASFASRDDVDDERQPLVRRWTTDTRVEAPYGRGVVTTLAVLGAGPGIGRAVASRFGREGYSVGLIARNEERLSTLVNELRLEGVESAAFPADLRDRDAVSAAIGRITDTFGPVDVLEYGPLPNLDAVPEVAQLDVTKLQPALDVLLLGAVHATSLVLPGMLERRDGALLFTQGVSSRVPMPRLVTAGVAAAGVRNWVYCLNAELRSTGLYAGIVTVGAMVIRGGDPADPIMIEPDVVAEAHWRLFRDRERPEEFVGNPDMFPSPAGW